MRPSEFIKIIFLMKNCCWSNVGVKTLLISKFSITFRFLSYSCRAVTWVTFDRSSRRHLVSWFYLYETKPTLSRKLSYLLVMIGFGTHVVVCFHKIKVKWWNWKDLYLGYLVGRYWCPNAFPLKKINQYRFNDYNGVSLNILIKGSTAIMMSLPSNNY